MQIGTLKFSKKLTGETMKRLLTAILVVLCPILALAGQPALIVDGDRLLISDGDGTVARDIGPASLLQNIHYMPGTTPTPPEEPDPESDVREEVADMADAIGEPTETYVMQQSYRTIKEKIADGTIAPSGDAVGVAFDAVFGEVFNNSILITESNWQTTTDGVISGGFQRVVLDWMSDLIIESGDNVTVEQWVALFGAIEGGLGDSIEGRALPDWLAPIIQQLIQALIQAILDAILNITGDVRAVGHVASVSLLAFGSERMLVA